MAGGKIRKSEQNEHFELPMPLHYIHNINIYVYILKQTTFCILEILHANVHTAKLTLNGSRKVFARTNLDKVLFE